MVQSLQLGEHKDDNQRGMKRLNRLPIVLVIVLSALFFGVVVFGISWRGLRFDRSQDLDPASSRPATDFADQLKRGVSDGIIGEPDRQTAFPAVPATTVQAPEPRPPAIDPSPRPRREAHSPSQSDAEWRARLKREQDEQLFREEQRQRMARLQAQVTAHDAPLKVDVSVLEHTPGGTPASGPQPGVRTNGVDPFAAAVQTGLIGDHGDPNRQQSKEAFFNQDIEDLGYLANPVVTPLSRFELKRGSVIPATLLTGIDSDLPGRISAQVSQNVFDSATGERLLVPQGAKLFGRYDSKVSFGQERVLVIWTDLVFPNGSTLRIGGMAGSDSQGYGGFRDKVDRHLWRTFGSAALIALIGTGIDSAIPEGSRRATRDSASDAARRNFAETFGRVAEQTISRNLNVQPTIRIRPGYVFNVLVDQDIVFPSAYRENR
jgi:type IV secretory pathway VirB10-like protein